MTVNEIISQLHLTPLSLPDGERQIRGAYTGDLLSWVMGRAQPGQLWVTIMTNINVVAVASLIDISAVIICDSGEVEKEVISTAAARGVNLLTTDGTSYEICSRLSSLGI